MDLKNTVAKLRARYSYSASRQYIVVDIGSRSHPTVAHKPG